MDNLVLTGVAKTLAASLAGSILEDLRQESTHRLRFTFRHDDGSAEAIVVSLRPELPWLGRPFGRQERPSWSPSPFVARVQKELRGVRLDRMEKWEPDRVVRWTFHGGRSLIAELATHGANLILLDPQGRVEQAAHHPRRGAVRLAAGATYVPPDLPQGKLVAASASSDAIDEFVMEKIQAGEEPFEALRRHVFGVGSAGATLVLAEAAASGRSVGETLAARFNDLRSGRVEPVVEAEEDPIDAAERGPLDPDRFKLWPWSPGNAGSSLLQRGDAAGTAGMFHEALERGVFVAARADALRGVLRQELRRTADAERHARGDADGFEDPDLWKRRGEALLAGLSVARREGDSVLVPDPYDHAGRTIAIPAAGGTPLPALAESCFVKQRRARRGLEAARGRVATLQARRERLETLEETWCRSELQGGAVESGLGEALRNEGIAVGLAAGTRAQRQARSAELPRLEGVRLVESRDGLTILVGRTGRDNDRLTFKIAGPDDFWFHVHGRPGAHVVVRNPDRLTRPPAATLDDAAAVAAWYSEGRGEGAVDVHWTRRKYVRRVRGGPAGRVQLKRFETIRATPRPLDGATPSSREARD